VSKFSDLETGLQIGVVILALLIVFGVICGVNWIGMSLWVYYAPMFNLPILSFWQFMGLSILVHLLFGNVFSATSQWRNK
jgi:hypothetical protein